MTGHTIRRVVAPTILVVAVALSIWIPVNAQAVDKPNKPMNASEMQEHCKGMMKQRTQLTADLKAEDADLGAQIARMNSAPADKKLDLMAAIITNLVQQRAAMNLRRETMQTAMGTHMSEHSQMGKGGMSQCPMMLGMQGE
jgi:hypothetical protein